MGFHSRENVLKISARLSGEPRSMDNMNVGQIPGQAWENPATMSTSYGFCEKEETGDSYRTVQELVQLLCDVVSKNGTLLLTVGPKGDGSIPGRQQERLIALGEWLQVNREAIYGSRPWKVFGEGEGEPAPGRSVIHRRAGFFMPCL